MTMAVSRQGRVRASLAEDRDPLINDLLTIEGVSGFVEVATRRRFQLDYSGYLQLIKTSYDSQMRFDKSLRQYLPFCAYQYYCIIALWKRLYDVLSSRGEVSFEHFQLNQTLGSHYPLREDIQLYLSGIGNIRDPSSGEFHFSIQSLPSDLKINQLTGSFGIIDAESHILYETLPAPIIAVLKMQADLNPDIELDWDLPAGLRPEDVAATLPTENLLGWTQKEHLTEDQRATLVDAGVTAQNPDVRNVANIPLFVELIKSVAVLLEESTSKAITEFPKNISGSQAQIPFITRSSEDNEINPLLNIAAKSARTNCYTQVVSGIASSSAILRYRIQRITRNEIDCVAYRFNENAIPQQWLDNSNGIFDYGIGLRLWNNAWFRLSEIRGTSNYANFSEKVERKAIRDQCY